MFERSRIFSIIFLCFSLFSLSIDSIAQDASYNQVFRPQYHFSASSGWLGDPNGMIRYQDTYHVFWWGHATSDDLVYWTERPYPMAGGDDTFIYFTGSVIVDEDNTSGFAKDGNAPMIAIYTMHDKATQDETQGLSISHDYTTFDFYEGNPVLDADEDAFRDPTVFWHKDTNRWVMAITMPEDHSVRFYASEDLINWEYLSEFGSVGAQLQIWEVPDLFEITVDDDPNHTKWVLMVGMGPNRVQYFVGDFDGTTFILDEDVNEFLGEDGANWLDYGSDYYAVRTYRDYDEVDDRIISLGWMGNWEYAQNLPTSWGDGVLSLPRELKLQSHNERLRIVQSPLSDLQKLRETEVLLTNVEIEGTRPLTEFVPVQNTYELDVTFEVTDPQSLVGVQVAVNGEFGITIGYDSQTSNLFIDRTNLELGQFLDAKFPKYLTAPVKLIDNKIRLHIFVDKSTIEVFANDGEVTMTALMFPRADSTGIELFSTEGSSTLTELKAWELRSIWDD